MELTKPGKGIRRRMYELLRNTMRQGGDKALTRQEFACRLKIKNHQVDKRYLHMLCAEGFVRETETEKGTAWAMVKDAGIDAPRFHADGTMMKTTGANEAIWQAMRILKTFSRQELAAHVVNFAEGPTVASYIKALDRAGYLKRGGTYHNPVYTLIRNTGPQPLQILRVKEVYDPNTDEIVSREVPDYE